MSEANTEIAVEVKVEDKVEDKATLDATAAANPSNATAAANPSTSLQTQVQQVVDGISSLLAGRKITEALLIRVVANCMSITARMKMQNHIKKEVVVRAIETYIKEKSDLSQDETDALMALVDVIVADAIDTIADVKKGNIDLSTKACCIIL